MFAVKSMTDAMTERSPAYAILAIDSEDRFKDYTEARAATSDSYNSSPYAFQITKDESMMNGFFTRLALTEVNFPWTIPNINKYTDAIFFSYQIGAGAPIQVILDIDYGFYTPGEIAAVLETEIQALDPALATFKMNYGSPAAISTFTVVSAPIFCYAAPLGVNVSFEPLPYNSALYPYNSTCKQLFDLLGFQTAGVLDNTALVPAGIGQITYCQAIRYIDIVCSQLTYNQALKDTMSQQTARDTMCRLYLGDGPYTGTSTMDPSDPDFCPPGCAPFTIYRQFTNPKFIRWLPNQPVQGNLLFEVYDDNGTRLDTYTNTDDVPPPPPLPQTPLTIHRGANWSMTMLVSED